MRQQDKTRWLWRTLLAIGITCLTTAGVLTALIVTNVWEVGGTDVIGASTPYTPTANLTPDATATAPLPTPVDAPIARLVIPTIDVDAPVQVKGVDANNVMVSSDGPTNVAWYDFSGKPGFGSNAVFSGHVDYIDYGPAVLWHLKELVAGDVVEVHLDEGTVYTYAVESLQFVQAEPTQEELRGIVGPTPYDSITMITCGGDWNPETHQYDHRTVVRARRVLDPPVAPEATPAP